MSEAYNICGWRLTLESGNQTHEQVVHLPTKHHVAGHLPDTRFFESHDCQTRSTFRQRYAVFILTCFE